MMPSTPYSAKRRMSAWIIDGPHDNFLSRSLYFADQFRFGQVEAGNHVLNRKFVPQAELILELTNQAKWNRRVQGVHRLQHSRLKGRDDESPPWLVPEKQVEDEPLQPFDLEFDVEKRIPIALENIPQPGQLRKLLGWCSSDVVSGELRIVTDHRLFILAELNIEFESIAAVGQCAVKGS